RPHRHRRTHPGEPRVMSTSPDLQPILLDGAWRPSRSSGSFHAWNPTTGEAIVDHHYPISGWDDIEAMLEAGREAAAHMARLPADTLAGFLERYADAIEARAEALIEAAHRETGLPVEPRLRNAELPRTTGQLRQAAEAARDGSWRRATIDTSAGLRSIHAPLGGPVVVFGPNNFPYAFNGIAGGDFAAAIAAGNPVVAKAHPSHPRTSVLLAEAALEAAQAAGLPSGAVQMFFRCPGELGLRLVADPRVGAAPRSPPACTAPVRWARASSAPSRASAWSRRATRPKRSSRSCGGWRRRPGRACCSRRRRRRTSPRRWRNCVRRARSCSPAAPSPTRSRGSRSSRPCCGDRKSVV